MKISNFFLLPVAILALSLSGTAIAKQQSNHNNKYNDRSNSDSSMLNSNRQSDEGSFRGRERADERQQINDSRDINNFGQSNNPEKQPKHKR
ncbi:MAG: hypothetical protein ACXWAT_04400 [Methylobacter sp.]